MDENVQVNQYLQETDIHVEEGITETTDLLWGI